MAGFFTKETNDFGEYEITFQSKKKADFERVQTLCRAIMDEARNDELIRRGDMIESLQNHYAVCDPKQNAIMDECVMIALKIPSAKNADEKIGCWHEREYGFYECDQCGKTDYVPYSFCPYCGARMGGAKE